MVCRKECFLKFLILARQDLVVEKCFVSTQNDGSFALFQHT